MKTNFIKLAVLVFFMSFTSCNNDDDVSIVETVSLETKTYSNLYAPQSGGQGQTTSGGFTKFSFSEGAIVTSDNWDIAFRGTTLIVNGGEAIGLTDEPTRTGDAAVSVVTSTFDNLTKREKEIIGWVCQGYSTKEIADKLFLSVHTIEKHKKNITSKTSFKSNAELIQFALNFELM